MIDSELARRWQQEDIPVRGRKCEHPESILISCIKMPARAGENPLPSVVVSI